MAPRLATLFVFAALLSTPLAAAPSDKAPNLADSIGQQPFRQWLAGSGLGRMLRRNASDLVVTKAADGSERLVLGPGFRQVILVKTTGDGRAVTSCVSTAAEAEAFFTRPAAVEKQP